MISIRKATESDVEFMIECINKDYQINDYQMDFDDWIADVFPGGRDLKTVQTYVNPKLPQDLYIVNTGYKDVGFFSQDVDETNSTIGGIAFMHRHACKMAILKIIKAIAIRGTLISDNYRYFEYNTWNKLIVTVVQSVIPSLKEFKITDGYRIVVGETNYSKEKVDELTEILKDERVGKLEIKEHTNYIDYLIISFELNYEKKIQFDICLSDMKDYQSRSLSIEEISSQFDKKFAKLKEYLESKNKGELKELEDKISEYEAELKKAKEQYDKINDYGENL